MHLENLDLIKNR
ncbi:c67d559f-7f53-481b-8c52-2fd0d5510853 [Thermothielavioides terrestris]|uniref:C67d559f-7f53-481b-8c52-2fd0d5510853 n=1 Tax=Thermothielavioides terrestris TaxID=2587410 RepID=A0A3S4F1B0_9PEZI|nr:c67d559f-7f53-481b-8c52-2fd0d5510853 [Thermothielavioides terrestris]